VVQLNFERNAYAGASSFGGNSFPINTTPKMKYNKGKLPHFTQKKVINPKNLSLIHDLCWCLRPQLILQPPGVHNPNNPTSSGQALPRLVK
jgi:hypothetical protein